MYEWNNPVFCNQCLEVWGRNQCEEGEIPHGTPAWKCPSCKKRTVELEYSPLKVEEYLV